MRCHKDIDLLRLRPSPGHAENVARSSSNAPVNPVAFEMTPIIAPRLWSAYSLPRIPRPNSLDFAHCLVEVSMRCRFVSLRRIAAFSVAVALVVTPVASAQTPASESPNDAPGAVLLSPTAFARLVQPPPTEAPVPVLKDPPRIDLLRQGRVAVPVASATQQQPAPPTRSWVSRHKVLVGILIGVTPFVIWGAMLWHTCSGGGC